MNLMLIVLTNGREDVFDTVPVALRRLRCDFNIKLVVDDSGDELFHDRLHVYMGDEFTIVKTGETNMGFTRAMGKVMELVTEYRPDYVFLLEEDFFIETDIDVPAMSECIRRFGLFQMALLRNPWWHNEVEAGGVIEAREVHGAEFHLHATELGDFITHRDHWVNGPNLFPAEIARLGWPQQQWSESAWGHKLMASSPASFAYWGNREVMVTHVGERSGHGY